MWQASGMIESHVPDSAVPAKWRAFAIALRASGLPVVPVVGREDSLSLVALGTAEVAEGLVGLLAEYAPGMERHGGIIREVLAERLPWTEGMSSEGRRLSLRAIDAPGFAALEEMALTGGLPPDAEVTRLHDAFRDRLRGALSGAAVPDRWQAFLAAADEAGLPVVAVATDADRLELVALGTSEVADALIELLERHAPCLTSNADRVRSLLGNRWSWTESLRGPDHQLRLRAVDAPGMRALRQLPRVDGLIAPADAQAVVAKFKARRFVGAADAAETELADTKTAPPLDLARLRPPPSPGVSRS